MADAIRVEGLQQAVDLANRMKEVGDKEIIPTLRRELNAGTKDTRRQIRDRIRSELPHAGGLDRWAGTMPSMSTHIERDRASVKLRLSKRGHDLAAMNRTGLVRHPLFGNRKRWYETRIPSHWFETAVQSTDTDALRRRVFEAVEHAVTESVMRHGATPGGGA